MVVLIYGLSQPTAKAQEGGSSPAKKCECPDCGGCYACDTNCNCVHVDDLCCGVTCGACQHCNPATGGCVNNCTDPCHDACCNPICTNPCAPTCVGGVCQPKCASPLACCNGTCYDPKQCLTCSNGTVVSTCTDPCYPNCDGNGNCLPKTCNTNGCEICSDGVCV